MFLAKEKTKIVSSFILLLILTSIPFSYAEVQKNQNQAYIIGCPKRGDSCFTPCQITVKMGDTVTWFNRDSRIHMITSGSAQGGPNGWFSSKAIAPNGIFSHTFDRKGAFTYFDNLHPYAQGVVIVDNSLQSSFVKMHQLFFSDWCNR